MYFKKKGLPAVRRMEWSKDETGQTGGTEISLEATTGEG